MFFDKKNLDNRVHLIDEARGFSIVCMVVYHTFYDLAVIFGMNIPIFYTEFVNTLVTLFAGLFIFISGSACLFSRNNLKRGFYCLMLGMAITAFTFFFMRDSLDAFGILHMLGINIMLFPLFAPLVKKITPIWGIIGCMFLYFFTYNLENGFIGFENIFAIDIPSVFYKTSFLFPIGLPSAGFLSVDYFPLIPWIFCFCAGSFFGVLLKDKRLSNSFYKIHLRPLAFVGRHTLIIYILHQPVVICILTVIFWLIG